MANRQVNEVIQHLRRVELPGETAGLTDGQLLEEYLGRRSEAALETLVRRHGPMVWGVCQRILRNPHDAEDAFQAAFLVFVRKASSIVPREMAANWLFGVARQTALKARATAAIRKVRERQVANMPEASVTEQELWRDLQPILDEELSSLPDKYRVVIVLCDLEGKTRKEAARQLGCPEGTVAGRLARARTLLARRLTRHGPALSGSALATILSQVTASANVPPTVLSLTTKAAILFAARQASAAGVISAKVASLTEGVLKAMLVTKFKMLTTLVVVLGLGAIGITYGMHAGGPAEEPSRDRKPQQVVSEKQSLTMAARVQPARLEGEVEPKNPSKNEVKKDADPKVIDLRFKPFKDDDLLTLPQDIDGLLLRGRLGYGSNIVTDAGIKHLTRFSKLRILAAGGLELTDHALETIGKLTELQELSLDSNKITGAGLRHLADLTKLRRLDLNFNEVNPDTLKVLVGLPKLTKLGINSVPVDDGLCELCGRLTHLRELQLSEYTRAVSDRGVEHLAHIENLENLALKDSLLITDAGLANVGRLKHLKRLHLSGLRTVTPEGMKVLGALTELRSLEIDFVRMDQASVGALTALKKLENLLLWAVNNHENPIALDCLGELRSLRTFRTQMPLSSSAIRALARLPDLESITDELFEVTNEDLTHLARLPKLKTLILTSPKVTAAALPTLAKMKSLRELYVTEKVGITPEQWTRLGQDSLPLCKIGSFRPPYTVYYEPKP